MPIATSSIQQAVADHFGMTRAELLLPTRMRRVARPRQLSMYLTHKLTTRSLPEIAGRHGMADHTTALHAIRRVTALIGSDGDFLQDVDAIATRLIASC